jgi:small subunit ribosomal protein S6
MERLMRLNEDVMRVMTLKVKTHEKGPSIILKAKSRTEEKTSTRQRYDNDASYNAH